MDALHAGILAGVGAVQTTWAEGTWNQSPAALGSILFGQPDTYATRRAWYDNTIFEDLQLWHEEKQLAGMYRATRPIYNPVRRLVNFYAAAVYPGVLAVTPTPLPDGIQEAMPLDPALDPTLRAGLMQAWQWGGWQALKTKLVRQGAIYGDSLIEIADDLDRRKVYPRFVPASQVAALHLTAQGDVRGYTLAYWVRDPESTLLYQYAKVVSATSVTTYRDGKPWAYDGRPAVYPLPYGFVPAVWVRHQESEDVLDTHGQPAAAGSYNKIARLMALGSHVHDQVHKAVGAPAILWSDAPNGIGIADFGTGGASASRSDDAAETDDEDILLLHGPAGGSVDSLLGNLPLDQALKLMEHLQAEVEADHPPLHVWEELRGMSQVTGPAAQRLLGDAWGVVDEAQAMYDAQVIKLLQMTLAIGGWRAQTGAWGPLTGQQRRLAPFDLLSYEAGQLDFVILPRPLVPQTASELLMAETQQYGVIEAATAAGIPMRIALQRAGWTKAQIAEVEAAQQEAETRAEAVAAAQAGDAGVSIREPLLISQQAAGSETP